MPALHQALRRLRVQTGLPVAARDGHCAIRGSWGAIDYDVRRFEDALAPPLARERAQAAVALYQVRSFCRARRSAPACGPIPAGRCCRSATNTLEQLASAAERDTPQLAIHYYQQVLQVDGCREQTAAQLMRPAARYGNRSLVEHHIRASERRAPQPRRRANASHCGALPAAQLIGKSSKTRTNEMPAIFVEKRTFKRRRRQMFLETPGKLR